MVMGSVSLFTFVETTRLFVAFTFDETFSVIMLVVVTFLRL